MALQDIPPYDPNAYLDPKTGQPYPYGSPEYQAAVLPALTKQLQSQAQRAANARGNFYSGAAMADEQQVASGLAGQIAQAGAAQAAQERQLLEQQKFQAQQNAQQQQSQMDLMRKQGQGQMLAGAVQGGMNGLGSLGGMYAASKFFGPKAGAGAADAAASAGSSGAASAVPNYNALMSGGGYDPGAAANVADYVAGGSPSIASSGAMGGMTGDAATDAILGTQYGSETPLASEAFGAPGAGGSILEGGGSALADSGGLFGADIGAGSLLGGAGMGAMGGMMGYNVGGGGGVGSEVGAGLGGLGGAGAGALIGAPAGPIGVGLGALIGGFGGSAAGKQIGEFFTNQFPDFFSRNLPF